MAQKSSDKRDEKGRHGSQFVRKIRGGRCSLLYLRRGSQVRYRGPGLYSCPLICYSSNRRHLSSLSIEPTDGGGITMTTKDFVWREVSIQRPYESEVLWDILTHIASLTSRGATGVGGPLQERQKCAT
jgi:hypothetical protein